MPDVTWSSRSGRPRRTGRIPPRASRTPRARRNQLANAAESDDAERLVGQLHAGEPLRCPPPPGGARHAPGRCARDREQDAGGVLGRCDHVRTGAALATGSIPRRVAAATSTLSTPVPARPMTFEPVGMLRRALPRHWSRCGTTRARTRPIAGSPGPPGKKQLQVDVDLELGARRLDPRRAVSSVTRTLLRHRRPKTWVTTGRHPRPRGPPVGQLGQSQLKVPRARIRMSKFVHVAHVADAHDAAARLRPSPPARTMPWIITKHALSAAPRRGCRRASGTPSPSPRQDRRRVPGRDQHLHALAAPQREAAVVHQIASGPRAWMQLERLPQRRRPVTAGVNAESFFTSQSTPCRRRSRSCRGGVERSARSHAAARPDANAGPGGVISAFCDPGHDGVDAPGIADELDPPRLETALPATSAAPVGAVSQR